MPPEAPALPLRDIHAAPPPEWWPPAIGWWLLAAAVVLLLAAVGWKLWQARRRRQRRQRLIEVYEPIRAQRERGADAVTWLRETADFLRRLIVGYAGQKQWAAATGDDWERVLLSPVGQPDAHQMAAARALAHDVYRPASPAAVEPAALDSLVVAWIERATGNER